MPLTVEQFTQRLTSSGVMSTDELRDWIAAVPIEKQPSDGEALARELVRVQKLTKFQAEQLYAGKEKSLTLGNYVILDKFGQGGMGMVLKAQHKRMARVVALKVMSPAAVKSPDAVKRFHREVQTAAKLTHPNIVTAFDADEAKGTHFLVMEYVEGDDLSQLVKKHGTLSVEQTIEWMIQAARGLTHAHAEGVIHRDIKPANLLLDKHGTMKILDMGLARLESGLSDAAGVAAAGLTQTGTIMGTVDYMSPEQAEDTRHADARADIYSLGCSLYYLLTGHAVYGGETMMKKLLAHRDAPLPSLVADASSVRTDARSVGHALDSVFHKMIAKRVEDRYQTMGEVIADLERCRAGQSVTKNVAAVSGESGSNYELQKFLRQISGDEGSQVTNATSSGPFGGASVGGTAETVFTTNNSAGTDPQTELTLASGQKRQSRNVLLASVGVVLLLLGSWWVFRTPTGTVRLEITEDQIEVTIGETGRSLRGVVEETIKLPVGEHVLHIKRNDLAFDTDAFEVTQAESVSIKVERVGRRVRAMQGSTLLGHKESAKSDAVVGSQPPAAKAPFDTKQAHAHQAAWAKHLGTTVVTTNSVGAKMVLIPPGEFLMGSSDEQVEAALKVADKYSMDPIQKAERPQHRVVLSKALLMDATEVTVGQFKKFAAAASYQTEAEKEQVKAEAAPPPSTTPGQPPAAPKPTATYLKPGYYSVTDDFPAAVVTWNDAVTYCNWLSLQEKLELCYRLEGNMWLVLPNKNGYRLPTEAEWEYACRAGTTTQYSFGDDPQQLDHYGWYNKNCHSRYQAVGTKSPNAFGLFDMHGNVWEWCQDFYDEKWYEKSPLIDPHGPDAGSNLSRVFRGGGWRFSAPYCRSAYRDSQTQGYRNTTIGFRCVRALSVSAVSSSRAANSPITNPDRRAAEYVLSIGGTVFINENGQRLPVGAVGDLPGGKSELFGVDLVNNQKVSDIGLAVFKDCKNLTHLYLSGTKVSDAGLALFKDCKNLLELELGSTKVTNAGLAVFQDCKNLTYLQLSNTQVTDAGLAHLKNCKNLTYLDLHGTRVNDAALAGIIHG